MPDERGWPDPKRPGYPKNPDHEGPHLIIDEDMRRRWAWWRPRGGIWGYSLAEKYAPAAGWDWTYIGPAMAPDGKPV